MTTSDPGLGVAAVARRLGVAPATVRSWERRYGLGPSLRTSGAHRRYTARDVAVLDRMRRLTLEGVAPADAARVALLDPAAVPTPPGEVEFQGEAGLADQSRAVDPAPGDLPLAVGPLRRDAARGLSRAALALDTATIRAHVRAAVGADGAIATWESLLIPVLRALREGDAGAEAAAERALVEAASAVLAAIEPEAPAGCRPVLLTCVAGHTLPLHALAAALAERRVAARVLGPLPPAAVAAAVRRTGPAVLFVHAHDRPEPALLDVPVQRPPTAVLAGGPGWAPEALPERVTYAHDLGEAVHLVLLATGVL